MLVKYGHSVCRCGLEEERTRRSVEIPTWMFESARCGRLRVMTVPIVDCDALCALKAVPADLTTRAAAARRARVESNRSAACETCSSVEVAA